MYDRISNVESDADLKTRAMAYILREICLKYKKQRDPIVKKRYTTRFKD
jgi:hypothetical protein